MDNKTIYALSTVYGKSGVAIVRASGNECLNIIKTITNIDINKIKPRYAYFSDIKDNVSHETIDKCLILYFKAPYSFTGEDVLEIQCHGSKAVLNSVFKLLSSFENIRLAEPGEFSKRAFYHNKMDLTEAEGLADLIDAETSEQQKYAILQMEGNLKKLYYSWRESLVEVLAYIEAFIDFPDEDIPENVQSNILNTVFKIKEEIKKHLENNNINERLKEGFRIVITGNTNAGKSSLINSLTNKNTMIVSDIAGTTRDAVDINLDINGYPVIITDTAGIRKTDNPIEKIGIDIALDKINKADIIICLYDATEKKPDFSKCTLNKTIIVANKIDKLSEDEKKEISAQDHIMISAKYGFGIKDLTDAITNLIKESFAEPHNPLITRERYRESLMDCLDNLDEFNFNKEIELAAEDIRLACRSIGCITGEIAVSEILDKIFGSFCIGK